VNESRKLKIGKKEAHDTGDIPVTPFRGRKGA